MNKHAVLRKYWGYDKFLPIQEQIIDSVLKRVDTLAILPTGGGKSLCYQLPSLFFEGKTIVISPLISIMHDQVKSLNSIGIKSLSIESSLNQNNFLEQIDNILYGDYKIIYVSPERFIKKEFLDKISKINIDLIAVDEAHCISEWGHDFRPSYRMLKDIKNYFPESSVLGLTATATKDVIKDIENILRIKPENTFKMSLLRSNICFKIIKTVNKIDNLLYVIEENKDSSGIIYCSTKNETEQINNVLKSRGVLSTFYHGDVTTKNKKKRLDDWIQDKINIMVSTSAFGMGIDKKNVRYIIHYSLPDSIENYYQQIGRSGRDGHNSFAYLLLKKNDFLVLKNRFINNNPDKLFLEKCLKNLFNYLQIGINMGEGQTHFLDFQFFCETYNLNLNKTYACFKIFEHENIFKIKSLNSNELMINIVASQNQVYDYLERRNYSSLFLEHLIRSNESFYNNPFLVKILILSTELNLSLIEVENNLRTLKKHGIINFNPKSKNVKLKQMMPRQENSLLKNAFVKLIVINNIKIKKIKKMIDYVDDSYHCKRNLILDYFGEKAKLKCGNCSAIECN
jgi:ATP-dependent DNA helicase RecQ